MKTDEERLSELYEKFIPACLIASALMMSDRQKESGIKPSLKVRTEDLAHNLALSVLQHEKMIQPSEELKEVLK